MEVSLLLDDCGCNKGGLDLPIPQMHPKDHDHDNETLFIYQDYYLRTREGESAELCATLSRPAETGFQVYYQSYFNISTEVEEGEAGKDQL